MNRLRRLLNFLTWPSQFKLAVALALPALLGPLISLYLISQAPVVQPGAGGPLTVLIPLSIIVLPSLLLALLAWFVLLGTLFGQVRRIRDAINRLIDANFTEPIRVDVVNDELTQLAQSVNVLGTQIQRDLADLETRVVQRTRDLEAARDIGQILSGLRDVDQISNQVISLILSRFTQIYHAQVFLVDEAGVDAVLQASTGEAGRILLERRHRLSVGSQSVIGQVTIQGKPVVAIDTEADPVHRKNPLLPETRAECALPLRVGEQTFGALDLQSKSAAAFAESDIRLFQTVADQLAISIQNARLLQEAQQRIQEVDDLNRLLINEAWQDYMQMRRRQPGGPTVGAMTVLQRQAIDTNALAEQIGDDLVRFAVPIALRGQVIGAAEWELPRAQYNDNTRSLAQELAARLALASDNARLLEQTQRLVGRERLINTISSKLTQQTAVEQILQTAVRELGQALPVSQTSISLTRDV